MKERDLSLEQMAYNSMTFSQKLVYNAKKKATSALVGAGLVGLLSACGPDPVPNPESPVDPSYELADNVSPNEGSYSGDGTIVFGVTLPEVNPDYDGTVTGASVDVDLSADNNTSDTSDDPRMDDIINTEGQPGEEITQRVDISSMYADGEAPESETLTATVNVILHTEEDGDIQLDPATLTYTINRETTEDRAVVESCHVSRAEVGTGLGISCYGHDSQDRELRGNWTVSGGPEGTEISRNGAISAAGELDLSDVADYTIIVGVLDSNPYEVHVQVGEHRGYVLLDNGHEVDMPIEDVEELLANCDSNYDGSTTGIFNSNDAECLRDQVASWSTDRQLRQQQYNADQLNLVDAYTSDVENATIGIGERPSQN